MYKDRKPQGVVDEGASIDELKIHKQLKQQQNIPLLFIPLGSFELHLFL